MAPRKKRSGKDNLIAVEAVPAGSKPPMIVNVRISTDDRHGFGAAAPLSTTASSLQQGRAIDSNHRSWQDTLLGRNRPEQKSYPSAAASSVCLRVLMSCFTSAFVGGGRLVFCPAVTFLDLFTVAPRKKRSGKDDPHCCRGCAGRK